MYRTALPLPVVWIENALPGFDGFGQAHSPALRESLLHCGENQTAEQQSKCAFHENRPNFMSRFRALTTDCVVMSGGTDKRAKGNAKRGKNQSVTRLKSYDVQTCLAGCLNRQPVRSSRFLPSSYPSLSEK